MNVNVHFAERRLAFPTVIALAQEPIACTDLQPDDQTVSTVLARLAFPVGHDGRPR
jgi:hypothetical protein